MKKLIFIFFVSLLSYQLSAQSTVAMEHAKELLEVTGSGKLSAQMINNMVGSYRKQLPNVPTEFWDEFIKQFNVDDLIELLVPVYVKHYTDEEMVQLIAFYKTALGKKVIEKLPLISQDSYNAGQEWGRRMGEKVLARLKEKGYMQN